MEIAVIMLVLILLAAVYAIADSRGFRRGFQLGCKDEQVLFGLVFHRMSKKNSEDSDIMNKVAREYNVMIMELEQYMKDSREGR